MAKTVGIGIQNFQEVRERECFYIDKTSFIKEWWESEDEVTLITRPRRFGKTLNMSMVEQFFSVNYKDRGDLFEGLSIWEEEKYRELQGTYPLISLSFAEIKNNNYRDTRKKICQIIKDLYCDCSFLLKSDVLEEGEQKFMKKVSVSGENLDDVDAAPAIRYLSKFLYAYYGKKVIILLDEYDTPMQEAYVSGYWEELVGFTRNFFNSTFKGNPYMARAIMTGITRVSKESMFSDLNNLNVVSTTSNEYATAFGFTEEEVLGAMEEYGLEDKKEEVKRWYDGFVFGEQRDIYNPWSIIQFLSKNKFAAYWANTSSNRLAGKLIREGSKRVKTNFETLLRGETIVCPLDEQIVYNQLDRSESAIWSLLLASGYLKAVSMESAETMVGHPKYELTFTNYEVKCMFETLIQDWFEETEGDYNDFVNALLKGDMEAMNEYMNLVAEQIFSSFDTGRKPSRLQPERFYHGFVLGLIVELSGRYVITSNRESGLGRYDVMLEPQNREEDGIILEFKVFDPKKEKSLEDTVQSALKQIEEKKYETNLIAKGIPKEQIRKYGFAFEGEIVLIGNG